MRRLLSVSLEEDLSKDLNRATRETHLTRSQFVKLALRGALRRHELAALRARLVPLARAKGIYTDDDVFRMIRS
ncbi:MAG: hypothetical protein A3C53_04525 [Omnitrophica WOR_2 bacterium RIFCSPHIGHO2_02_FULL_68_15]|nr:MAG: hypothetical protein A3C53_04525 [Omnitrophica WOR_2 bacterium RIFCSPHIGHO2_02_FULL_68_15]